MITLEDAMKVYHSDIITGLDTSMFSDADILNILLQRSEVLNDQPKPGKIIRAWTNGDTGPIDDIIARMGHDLIKRAAAFIYLEFLELRPHLDQLSLKRVADIGCGYAFVDLFMSKTYDNDIVLIDIEENEHRHFGFEDEGAAYTSLSVARAMLEGNGIAADRITTINPNTHDLGAVEPVDLVTSFVSCGFHYPYDMYMDFYKTGVVSDGFILLDLRRRKADAGIEGLSALGSVDVIEEAAYGSA
ncbi:class I SAM-dependent methyltransferase, partial [Cochlodiniinecator piscidefendens]|uniref:hypothetical protein n=1 Tax=Cochlodiniinecator piscidefendens TaxID=2715756 RepID=UPI00140B5631